MDKPYGRSIKWESICWSVSALGRDSELRKALTLEVVL